MNSVFFRRILRRSLVALPLILLLTFSVSGAAAAFKNVKVGDQALPVQLEDLEGQEHSLSKYRESKAILLFFWATWSERSLTQLADLNKFQTEYGEKGLQILAVNVENQKMDAQDLDQIRSVLEKNEINYPVLIDQNLRTYNEWGVIATPSTAIVTGDGVITFDLSSYPSSAYLDMDEAIQKAIGIYVEEEKAAEVELGYVPNRAALLRLGLGKRHAQKGFMTKALPELEKAAVADTGWAEPHIYLGLVHFRMGENEKASESLEKASQLDPERLETVWLKSYLLVAEEKVDEAIALLQSSESAEAQIKEPGSAASESSVAGTASPEETKVGTSIAADTPMATDAPIAKAKPGGQTAEPEPLDLSEVLALKDAGKNEDAVKALEDLLSVKLGDAGLAVKKKKKMSAMEKMQLMMQEKKAP